MASNDEIDEYYKTIEAITFSEDTHNWHFGYWPENSKRATFEEAQDHMTDLIINRLPQKEGQSILDVGCGIGGPAIRLVKKMNCFVTGITNSHFQIEKAQVLTEKNNLSNQISFQFADAINLPFGNESFDATIALESMGQIPDNDKAMGEIARVLKPGGTFVFADGYAIRPISKKMKDLLYYFFLAPSIHTEEELVNLLKKSGFEVKEMTDYTEQTKRSMRELLILIFRNKNELRKKYGDEFDTMIRNDLFKISSASKDFGYIMGTSIKRENHRNDNLSVDK